MLIARENMQFAIHATAEDGFRQHALDGELQDALRMLLEELLKRDRLDPAIWGARRSRRAWNMSTVFAKPATVRGDWFVVDAKGKTLGRLASQIALRLKGKHKADYSPHVDMGDHIVVVNAEQVKVTGAKLTDKIYYHHTGAIGGIKSIALEKLLKEHPERVLQFAIKGMLPKTILGRRMYRKLHVFAGDQHPHSAQQPKPLNI